MKKERWLPRALPALASALTLALLLWAAVGGVAGMGQAGDENGAKIALRALERGAAMCYAAEGYYPPSLDYLCGNYGVQVDREQYIIRYEAFASNQFPEIAVIPRG